MTEFARPFRSTLLTLIAGFVCVLSMSAMDVKARFGLLVAANNIIANLADSAAAFSGNEGTPARATGAQRKQDSKKGEVRQSTDSGKNAGKETDKKSMTQTAPLVRATTGNGPTNTTNVLPFRTLNLFDGKSLDGWEKTAFGGEGDIRAQNGHLVVDAGYPMSGFNSTLNCLPKSDYEFHVEARKADGIDFFVGLTFPVNDSHCTFIVGGWAGSVVGLSCIDGKDAARNDTKTLMKFENDRWYKIRVQVRPEHIQCWIDGVRVVDKNIKGLKISLRNETLPSRPLGICCFESNVEYRNLQLKLLTPKP